MDLDNGSHLYGLDAQIADRTIDYAQSLIARTTTFDLYGLPRRFGDRAVFIDLPIGGDLVVTLEIGLHPLELRDAHQMEAWHLAETVKDYLQTAKCIQATADRMRRLAQRLTREARAAGTPITVGRTRIDRQASACGIAVADVQVELLFLGQDLRSAGWWSRSVKVWSIRDTVAVLAEIAAPRARMMEVIARHGAVSLIDPIAYASMRHAAVTVTDMMESLTHRYHLRPDPPFADHFTPVWHDGVIRCEVTLSDDIYWTRDRLTVLGNLPDSVVHVAVGRPITDVVGHPALAPAPIVQVVPDEWSVIFLVEPLAPLLLMPDGSAIPVPDSDTVPVRPQPQYEPDRPLNSLRYYLFGVTGFNNG